MKALPRRYLSTAISLISLASHNEPLVAAKKTSLVDVFQASGTLSCPGSTDKISTTIGILVTGSPTIKEAHITNGKAAINLPDTTLVVSIDVTDGKLIDSKKFVLEGITDLNDVLCSTPLGTSVTITGECGTDATIRYTAANGVKGTYIGSVTCGKFSSV
jgi:hypothetical protein